MKVHSILGNGFQEVIYQRALAIELVNAKLDTLKQKKKKIDYITQKIPIL